MSSNFSETPHWSPKKEFQAKFEDYIGISNFILPNVG
jgi:hypothetical protein